jgi:hypothetical protein
VDKYEQDLDELLARVKTMLMAKHHDYGVDNLKRHGIFGIVVRLDDKMARISNLLKSTNQVKESIKDTFFDVVGYGLQAILMYEEKL